MRRLILGLVIVIMSLVGTDAFAFVGIDDYTVLMLHFNGEDGSTTFTDDSFSSHTVTAHDDAQIDTAEKKFDTGSALFDGAGDYLTIPDSPDWDLTDGGFTIDSWLRWNDVPITNETIITQYEDAQDLWYFNWGPNVLGADIGGLLCGFISYTGGYHDWTTYTSIWTPAADTWYHIALVKESGYVSANIYIDGVDTTGYVEAYDGYPYSVAGSLRIGYEQDMGGYFNGHMDEFRISKIARWTSDFIPPAELYSTAPISEPATLSLLGLGLVGLLLKKKRTA